MPRTARRPRRPPPQHDLEQPRTFQSEPIKRFVLTQLESAAGYRGDMAATARTPRVSRRHRRAVIELLADLGHDQDRFVRAGSCRPHSRRISADNRRDRETLLQKTLARLEKQLRHSGPPYAKTRCTPESLPAPTILIGPGQYDNQEQGSRWQPISGSFCCEAKPQQTADVKSKRFSSGRAIPTMHS